MKTFEWQIPDWHNEDEWREVKALDAESAAEKAGDVYDSDGDYLLSRSEDNRVTVRVRDAAGVVTVWRVGAVHTVEYHAEEVQDE